MSLQRFTIIAESDFNLYNRWLSGENIEPVCEQRAALGFNSPRIWTAYQIGLIGRLIPREHPDFYTRIPEFMDLLAGYGFYPEWTAFTGPYSAMFANDDEMVAHWKSLYSALSVLTNLLDLELVNEYDNPPKIDVTQVKKLPTKDALGTHADIEIRNVAAKYVKLFQEIL